MRALGRASYVAGIGLTFISLTLLSGPASSARFSGQQSPQSPQTSTAPKPTAAWMTAPANPLTIAVTLDQGSSVTERIRSGGGEIKATAPDGTRFTLTIPKDALIEGAEITMTPVAGIKNLPLSGGLVAAVHISPEDLLFSKAPTLIVKPPAPIPSGEQMQFASFAYRGDGQEFHLYPMETDPNRIAFKLLHFGGFGVARGTMPFLVMEFVQGKSLHDILSAEGALPPTRALEMMNAIGAGIALIILAIYLKCCTG